MLLRLHLLFVAGFAGLMAVAAFEDLRRLVIPNPLIIGLCALWPFYLATAPNISLAGGFGAVGCAAAIFGFGALLFSRGLIGGGDVKLLAVATLWASPGLTPTLLILTALLGGLVSLVRLAPIALRVVLRRPASTGPARTLPVPYGVAIAAASLLVTVPPDLS
jgi:prepilin peptidase CpaA